MKTSPKKSDAILVTAFLVVFTAFGLMIVPFTTEKETPQAWTLGVISLFGSFVLGYRTIQYWRNCGTLSTRSWLYKVLDALWILRWFWITPLSVFSCIQLFWTAFVHTAIPPTWATILALTCLSLVSFLGWGNWMFYKQTGKRPFMPFSNWR